MSNIDKRATELLIENGELVADTLRHLADNEIDSDYFAICHTNENGTEIECELAITDYARQAAGTVDELVKALEAKDNRINRLEAIVAVAEQRNALMREWKRALKVPCDLVDDQVPVVIHGMVIRLERLKETEAKLEAAEKRTAELEARTLVPVEPTLDQLVAGKRRLTSTGRMSRLMSQRLAEVYRAMVSAAAAGKGEAS